MFFKLIVILTSLLSLCFSGVVKVDQKCNGGILHEFRFTDCSGDFACTIIKGKEYVIDADFSVFKKVNKPEVKCATLYMGRMVDLPGHGDCSTLQNGSCPLEPNTVYTTRTTFKVHPVVKPGVYNVTCRLLDDDSEQLLCGGGSGKVV